MFRSLFLFLCRRLLPPAPCRSRLPFKEFSSSATNWSSVSVLTIAKNSANRNFYYKNTTAGTHTLNATVVLKPESESRSCTNWPLSEWPIGWTTTQEITVGSVVTKSASSTPPVSESIPVAGSTGAPSEPVPSLLVKISAPASVTVGADAVFSATVFGVKKEPIPNARVIWSFGNGAIREGLSVRYGYNIPGSYAVVVDASSGELSGSARMAVQAHKPNVRVSYVSSGADGFVEIENRSNLELDVSGWGLASAGSLFTIPARTIILPSAKVAFPAEVTKLSVSENDARLLYPNGTVAAEYVVPVVPPKLRDIPRLPTGDTPFQGGIKKSPLEGSTPTQVGGRDVPISTAPAAIVLSSENGSGVWKWLIGVFGISLAGIVALASFRFKPVQKDERSDAEKLVDEIQIV
ncbi:MAG: Uncharacterized protein G01um101417_624 [Parcubacteria group bacterium Gr01-1014_17]|nr:MAG: Uncharacterized protein G01um101417_624 [Parcubacteria group bacterium Gr01-1014_17]